MISHARECGFVLAMVGDSQLVPKIPFRCSSQWQTSKLLESNLEIQVTFPSLDSKFHHRFSCLLVECGTLLAWPPGVWASRWCPWWMICQSLNSRGAAVVRNGQEELVKNGRARILETSFLEIFLQRNLYLFVLKGSLAGLRQNHSDCSGASANHQVQHNCGASGTCPAKTGVVFFPLSSPILGMRILLD